MIALNKIICLNDTYEKYLDIFDNMKEKAGDYVPSVAEMNIIKENLPKYIPFLFWIDDTGIKTEENAAMRKEITQILKEYLIVAKSAEKEQLPTLQEDNLE